MMNLEQTKRMNFMIKELTKSGMVTSFDDAVSQAQGLYENSMPESSTATAHSTVIDTTPQTLTTEPNQKPVTEVKQEPATEVVHESVAEVQKAEELPHLVQRKMEFAIRHNNEQIAAEMRKIWDEVRGMKEHYQSEIERLNGTISLLKRSGVSEASAKPVQQTLEKPKSTTEATSRSGEFNPGDVELESYFYCGTR